MDVDHTHSIHVVTTRIRFTMASAQASPMRPRNAGRSVNTDIQLHTTRTGITLQVHTSLKTTKRPSEGKYGDPGLFIQRLIRMQTSKSTMEEFTKFVDFTIRKEYRQQNSD
ncbi:hypothetical protein ANCDUO_27502 [Ancylostoma duodenale]|uniref:Uncharacterized protein n=1 Tax=Ancylostoma duodenale TaxID=51022 RepID=A0A0C2BFJ2_9BILA|nr:hypothetical protein ANCDUO_27502 [Ancylostoma duodenale]